MFELVDSAPQSAVIKVIGVGGGGGNAVQHMLARIEAQPETKNSASNGFQNTILMKNSSG